MQNLVKLANQVYSGLRFRLLLMVAVACTPLVVLTLYTAWEDRRRAMEDWQQRSEKVLDQARREEEKLVNETRQLLLVFAESAPVRNGNPNESKQFVDKLFDSYQRDKAFDNFHPYANLGVAGTNGEIVASAREFLEATNKASHDFFRRVLETASFVIDDFPMNRTNANPIVNFGYPVFDRSGQAQATVFASIDLSLVNRFDSEPPGQLPRGTTWAEFDRKGNLLARWPTPRNWSSDLLPERDLLKTVLSDSKGVLAGNGFGGIPTVYAFATAHNQLVSGETVGFLGIPRHVLFATADATLRRNLAWLGLAACLALTFGWFSSELLFLRPVRALVRSSTRLAAGDLSARTGLPHRRDELGRLTLAFDLMAQALEQRDLDRKSANQKLQILSHRLVEVQESERRQIARELHDEIGQSLTVAEMNLQAALKSNGQDNLTQRLQDSIEAVELVLEQVHDLSLNLRPSMLDDLGLEPALRWYLNRQAVTAGLEARLTADTLEHRMDPVIETECFRVAQEALTNVVRHAQARQVTVNLHKNDGRLHLRVIDNGVGFDVAKLREEAVNGASLGLLSMEERASLAGGGLEFISSQGKGTEVHAWFPLRWREPDPAEPDQKHNEQST